MLLKCAEGLLFVAVMVIAALSAAVFFAYQIKSEGTLHLEHAWGTCDITREDDT